MSENSSVPVLVQFNYSENVCVNSSDMLQPYPSTSIWDFENGIYIGFISISFLIGIPGNTLVLIILISSKSRNNTDWFILFISIFSITGLLSEVPSSIIMKTSLQETLAFPNVCRYKMFCNYVSQCAQAFFFSVMSVERYRCVSVTNISKTNLPNRRGLVVSLILTALVILLETPAVVLTWDVVNETCNISPGQEMAQTIFYGGLTTLFMVLFAISIVSYALVLMTLYKKQRLLSKVRNVDLKHRKINIRPIRSGKVGVAVSDVSSTLTERCGEASTAMNTQLLLNKNTSVPATEVGALRPHIASRKIRQYHLSVMLSAHVTNASNTNKGIYLQDTRNENRGKQSSSTTSDVFNKPNSSQRNGMKRPTLIIFLTTLIFIISWLPPTVLGFVSNAINHAHRNSRSAAYTVLFMRTSHFLNNFINPILYLTLHTEARKRTKMLFSRSR